MRGRNRHLRTGKRGNNVRGRRPGDKAILDPEPTRSGSFLANHQRLTVLCRKWYGSTEQMLDFTRKRCTDLPDGHPLWSLKPKAFIEVWVDSWMVGNLAMRLYRHVTATALKKRDVRVEVDEASDRFLAAGTYDDHPWTRVAHQTFGAYYDRAGVRQRARTHLDRGGYRASEWPWRYFEGTPQTALVRARRANGL